MRRRSKVRKHVRKIGKKRVKIKKHSRITKKKRGALTKLADLPYEVGGQLDFEKGDLKSTSVYYGDAHGVEYKYDPDKEITWHTHTNEKGASIMPSYDDLKEMKKYKEKEQIILRNPIALSIYENKKFKNVPNTKLKKISDMIAEDYYNNMSDKDMYKKYKPILLNEAGLLISWHKKGKPIKLYSRSI